MPLVGVNSKGRSGKGLPVPPSGKFLLRTAERPGLAEKIVKAALAAGYGKRGVTRFILDKLEELL